MPEPIAERILQNIDAAFLAIDADVSGSPYFYTIGANQYLRADAAVVEVENGPYPFIVCAGIESDPVGGSSAGAETYIVEDMLVSVVGHLQTQTNVHRDLRRLEHDIRTAMWEDPTRGGLAIHTSWEGTELFYPLTPEGHALVAVSLKIRYEVKPSDLTATIP